MATLILSDKRQAIRSNKATSMSISSACLAIKLNILANQGLSDANKGTSFWSKREAMKAINGARMINPLW